MGKPLALWEGGEEHDGERKKGHGKPNPMPPEREKHNQNNHTQSGGTPHTHNQKGKPAFQI